MLPLLLFLVLSGYSISATPWVNTESTPSHYDIARVKKIIKKHDPRHLQQGQTGYLSLSEQDVNTLLITSLSILKKASAQTHFHANTAVIDLTIKLPDNEYGQYSNISLVLKNDAQRLLKIEKINFGNLAIPGKVIEVVWDFTHQYFYKYEEYKRLINAVQTVKISQEKITLAYTADWEAARQLKQRGQALLLTDRERQRIRQYQHKLAKIIKKLNVEKNRKQAAKYSPAHQQKRPISFSQVLQGMFQFALERSSQTHQSEQLQITNSAIAENKALLFVLAMSASGKDVDSIIGEPLQVKNSAAQSIARYKMSSFTLRNRVDLMQHFTISAFLSATAGDALAHATGLFKEVSDSMGGSGFSFADLAADRAGVEFGTMAAASESRAHFLQLRMSQKINENDFMPKIDHLPEGLNETSFKRQYGTTETDRYKKMQRELDERIGACPLYKESN